MDKKMCQQEIVFLILDSIYTAAYLTLLLFLKKGLFQFEACW